MKKQFLQATCLAAIAATAATICISCNDNGAQNKSAEVGEFLGIFTGTGTRDSTIPGGGTTHHNLTVNVTPGEGGTVSRNPNASSYEDGTPVTVTATPNNGYEFLGWTGALNSTDRSVTVAMYGDKTLSAGFGRIGANLPQYTVYFNANGATGTPPDIIKRDSGNIVSLPDQAGLVKDRHSFAGWNTEADGRGQNYDAFKNYTVIGNATLFAQWVRDTYTLTVNTTAGGATSRSPNQTKYDAGTQVTVIATPDEHFAFTGWSGASSSTNPTVTITMDGNKELTPVFTQNKYTLTINKSPEAGGSVSRNPDANSYSPGTEVTVTATAATALNYTFTEWSGASTATNPTVTITMDGNKTLTAGFSKKDAIKFTVTFNKNGATSGDVPPATRDSGTTITLGQGNLERNGYSFGGWNTNANGTGTKYGAEETYTVTKDITLYAKWIPIYTITFSGNGATSGNAPTAIKADSGGSAAMPVHGNLDKTGHTFGGWNTKNDGTGNNYGVGQTYTVINNVTLYAKWTAGDCNVNFNGNGATSGIPTAINATYGSSITLPPMTRTGYDFGGWYENSAGTGTGYQGGASYPVTKEVILYAKWTVVAYTITYTLNDGTVTPANPGSYSIETATFALNNPTRTGYTFTGWTGTNGATPQTSVSVALGSTNNRSYTANWTINTPTLTTTANPSGSGSFSRSPNSTNYDYGTNVQVTATATTGYTFTGWSGDASGAVNPVTVTMDKNKAVTANFVATYALTTTVTPVGSGTVSRSPDQGNYNAGASVTVTATAASGYTFTGWSGSSWSKNSPMIIIMDDNKVLTAHFYPSDKLFTDSRDAKLYKKVTIGSQTWMAENLNYQPSSGNSWCYGDKADSCAKYGRLYDWATAMGSKTSSTSNPSGVQGVCPVGWHLPSRAEWDTLVRFVGGTKRYGVSENIHYWYDAGKYLKSTSGWNWDGYNNTSGNGTDDFGFSALPGGGHHSDGVFLGASDNGEWWTATEYNDSLAYYQNMYYYIDDVYEAILYKSYGYSVRCLADN